MLNFCKSFFTREPKTDVESIIEKYGTHEFKKFLYKMNYNCPYCKKRDVTFYIHSITASNIYIECAWCGRSNIL